MEILHITHAGSYRHPEKGHHIVCPQKWISFSISGLIHGQSYFPDGTLRSVSHGPRPPSMGLSMPGFFSDCEYGSGRENYVVMYQSDAVIYQPEAHQIVLKYNDLLLPLANRVPIPAEEVNSMRVTFQTILEFHKSALPNNLASADLMLSALLLRFLQVPQTGDDPVEQFRKRLEEDVKWEIPMEEHCRLLGYSRDYLRRAFIRRYKITPGDYRIRKRLQQIINGFAYTNMSMKEIAFSVGMKNASHLNLLIRKYYGKTPTELCREYREKNMTEE